MPLQPYTFHVRITRPHQASVPLRTCHLNLSPENIRAGKFNVCLEYHIKNCAGPCIGKQSQEEYLKNIAEIKEILKGNTQEIERMLFQQMQELAAEMKFEESTEDKEEIPAAGKLPGEIGSGKQRAAQYRRVLHRRRQR